MAVRRLPWANKGAEARKEGSSGLDPQRSAMTAIRRRLKRRRVRECVAWERTDSSQQRAVGICAWGEGYLCVQKEQITNEQSVVKYKAKVDCYVVYYAVAVVVEGTVPVLSPNKLSPARVSAFEVPVRPSSYNTTW